MNDRDKTKEELISELADLRRRYSGLPKMSPAEKQEQAGELLGGGQNLLDAIIDAAPT